MFCSHCGNEIKDNASFCGNCGNSVGGANARPMYGTYTHTSTVLNTLSQRLNTNGVIWLVIGVLQLLGGLFLNWFLLIVAVANIVSAVQDMRYSKTVLSNPRGVVAKFTPIFGPVVILVYNLIIGGIIGVIGSLYYFFAIRSYVMEHRSLLQSLDV
ncbi:MAG: zinc ribbon domain-containing protein [Clostridia bacterium]|nr:zinc ribbon domain-containing protein [Clostridia bacterium]